MIYLQFRLGSTGQCSPKAELTTLVSTAIPFRRDLGQNGNDLHILIVFQDYSPMSVPSTRSWRPLLVTLVGLAWEGSPVASQHSYGGFSSGLPVSSQGMDSLLSGFLPQANLSLASKKQKTSSLLLSCVAPHTHLRKKAEA